MIGWHQRYKDYDCGQGWAFTSDQQSVCCSWCVGCWDVWVLVLGCSGGVSACACAACCVRISPPPLARCAPSFSCPLRVCCGHRICICTILIFLPSPSLFLRRHRVFLCAFFCNAIRLPVGILSAVCRARGTSVARAMAAESRRDWLYFAGYETLLSPGKHTLDVFKPRG